MSDMKLPRVLAVDFDGTLVTDKFPEIGEPNKELFNLCILARQFGTKVILWTCRNNSHLDVAVAYCKEQGLEFDAVNDNLEECKIAYGGNTRKVFADKYVDDKNIGNFGSLYLWAMGAKVGTELWL